MISAVVVLLKITINRLQVVQYTYRRFFCFLVIHKRYTSTI